MFISRIIHKLFGIPYGLHIEQDTKTGHPIIFLHGIASDSSTFKYVLPNLPNTYRAITIDLLGFGKSPKPKDSKYSTADHANSVIRTIRKLGIKNAVVVGHSMGGNVAIEVAKKRPDLVNGIILVSTPLYNPGDIIEATSRFKGSKRHMSNGLFAIYERIISSEIMTLKAAQAIIKIAPASNSFVLTKETWEPFKRSLTNTIMKQNSMLDVLGLDIPITIIYGKLDMLVQAKNYETLTIAQPGKYTVVSHNGAHMIAKGGAEVLLDAIETMVNLLENKTDSVIATEP